MSKNPLNLLVRFLLEIALLVIFGYWGFHKFEGATKYLMGIGLPVVVAILWGTFRVPNDPGKLR